MKKFLNQQGFSLVQVLMAAGLAGGLGLVITQLMTNMNKGLKNVENQNDVMTVVQSIQRVLATPENCTQTFLGKNPKNAANTVNALKDKISGSFVDSFKNITADPTAKYGQGQIRIKGFSLSDREAEVEVDTLRSTYLYVEFEKGQNSFGGKEVAKKIPLKVELDGAGNILSCIAMTNASDTIWKYSTNNIDIFFNGGNVGIGHTTPEAPLDVAGSGNFFKVRNNIHPHTNVALSSYFGFYDVNGASFGYMGDGSSSGKEIEIVGHNGYGVNLATYSGITGATYRGGIKLDGANGNVGINTASPLEKLHVTGNVRLDASGADGIFIRATTAAPSDSGDLTFQNNNGTTRAIIHTNNGPAGELHIMNGSPIGTNVVVRSGGNMEVAGNIRPATNAAVGAGCSPVGSFSYSVAANKPVYCNNSGVWTAMGGGGAQTCVTRSATVGNDPSVGTQTPASANCLADESVTGGACSFQHNHYDNNNENRCVWSTHQTFSGNGFTCQLINDSETNCYVRAMTISAHARCCK